MRYSGIMKSIRPTLCLVLLILAVTHAFGQTRTISVLYFENTTKNADYAWFSKGAADMLITGLAAAPEISVIEREQLQKIIQQQEESLSDLYDAKNAVRIGKLVSAGEIVIGAYIVLKDTLRIDAKVVAVETGKVEKSVQASGPLDRLFAVQRDLTLRVLKELGVKVPEEGTSDTESVEAAKAYYTGINFLDEGSFDQAARSFQQAVKFDPFYVKPQKSLEDAYRYLKDFRKQRFQRELAKLYEMAAQLKKRLNAPVFQSYGEFVTEAYKKGLSAAEIKKLTDANPAIMKGDTRAVCTWELQNTLHEIADAAEENFNDEATAQRMYREVIHITDQARVTLKDDPFFPEILYQELLALRYMEQWEAVMKSCENLMGNYPDYRMMWAVEDFYERAIEKLGGKKAGDD